MTIDNMIYSKLAALGTAYPDAMPSTNAVIPGMVYQFISGRDYPSHAGAGLTRRRLQVSCWGKTRAAANTLADSVKTALAYNQTNVELITPEDMSDFKDPEAELYRRIVEFFVWS